MSSLARFSNDFDKCAVCDWSKSTLNHILEEKTAVISTAKFLVENCLFPMHNSPPKIYESMLLEMIIAFLKVGFKFKEWLATELH